MFVSHAQDANDKAGHLAKLYLRDLRMQAFMYKAASKWGPSFQCSATGKRFANDVIVRMDWMH